MRSTCERVQASLPHLADGALPRWRRRFVLHHVGRCDSCATELQREEAVAQGLGELGEQTAGPEPPPPDDLLESILERVHEPGLRARVAAPARGAVSGARPELSVAAVLVTLALVYLAWRGARALVNGSTGRGGDD